jgi:hypothetical protein
VTQTCDLVADREKVTEVLLCAAWSRSDLASGHLATPRGLVDAYLKELLPCVRPGGLIIAHNMRRPAPNQRYVKAITTSPELDTSFVLMDGAGIGITLKKR